MTICDYEWATVRFLIYNSAFKKQHPERRKNWYQTSFSLFTSVFQSIVFREHFQCLYSIEHSRAFPKSRASRSIKGSAIWFTFPWKLESCGRKGGVLSLSAPHSFALTNGNLWTSPSLMPTSINLSINIHVCLNGLNF